MKQLILFSAFLLVAATSIGQDMIYKKDKSEMKVKVIEISDDLIKYKKWEMTDGPLYNIKKNEVFMIIYANGHREVIEESQATPKSTVSSTLPPATPAPTTNSAFSLATVTAGASDTIIDYSKVKVKYSPSRIYVAFSSPFTVGIDQEIRLIKNTLNFSSSIEYASSDNFTSTSYGLHLGAYLPLNRTLKNYKNQDKGLFLFGQAGYTSTSVNVNTGYGKGTYSSGGFSWRLGFDYLISRSFGISAFSYSLKSFRAGLVFNFF